MPSSELSINSERLATTALFPFDLCYLLAIGRDGWSPGELATGVTGPNFAQLAQLSKLAGVWAAEVEEVLTAHCLKKFVGMRRKGELEDLA